MDDTITREVLIGLWKIHILHHAERHPIYGLWMLKELEEHGYTPSPGTLYPLLSRMERYGWLRASPSNFAKARRTYRITAKGRRVLVELRERIAELSREIAPRDSATKRGSKNSRDGSIDPAGRIA